MRGASGNLPLRAIYRAIRNDLSVESFRDSKDMSEALAYDVKHYVESVRDMGFYRALRGFNDAVLMVAKAMEYLYSQRVTREFKQTDETKNWGGWDGTFRHDHAEAQSWLSGHLAALA